MKASNTNESSPVIIYTDGACKSNPGPGGWGVVFCRGEKRKELRGPGTLQSTNNEMELTAAIKALEKLKQKPRPVRLYSDSQYLIKGMNEWRANWKANGWRTSDRKPVANRELWERLDALASVHDVEWVWVKAHAGDAENERADQLANEGIRMISQQ